MNDDSKPSAGKEHLERLLDEALEESFPASDPVAIDFTMPQASWREANDNEPENASVSRPHEIRRGNGEETPGDSRR